MILLPMQHLLPPDPDPLVSLFSLACPWRYHCPPSSNIPSAPVPASAFTVAFLAASPDDLSDFTNGWVGNGGGGGGTSTIPGAPLGGGGGRGISLE